MRRPFEVKGTLVACFELGHYRRVANDHSLLRSDVLLGTLSLVDLFFHCLELKSFVRVLFGIADTSRVESRDRNGGYFVVFDARYGELEYLLFQTEGYTMSGPQELDGFHPHTPRHLHPDSLRP